MIKSVELFEFESHKHSFLEFDAGLNILAGSSGNGKSSIRRAIGWAVTNRPSGDSVISWDNFTAKGKQINPTRVVITLSDGTVIERIKSNELNGYIINGKTLEAVGTSVPEEITAAFSFKDVNIAKQLDPHFLISLSAGETARYLNEVVSLEEADTYQANIESMRKKTNTALTQAKASTETSTKELTGFDWIEKAQPIIKKLEKLEGQNQVLEPVIDAIRVSLQSYEEADGKLVTCEILPEAERIVAVIKASLITQEPLVALVSSIETELDRYNLYASNMEHAEVLEKADRIVAKIARLRDMQEDNEAEVVVLQGCMKNHTLALATRDAIAEELLPLESELALVDVCPLCNRKMDDCKEVAF